MRDAGSENPAGFSQSGLMVVIVIETTINTARENGTGFMMTVKVPLTFEALIAQYHDEIFGYLWQRLAAGGADDPTADAQDLTQDVFMRAYGAYDRLRPESNVRAWLYKIATNCANTHFKRHSRHAHHQTDADVEQAVSEETPDQMVAHAETLSDLREEIGALPTKQQAALVMRYLQELSYEEIADALDCSTESARANVSQGVRRLRRAMSDEIKGE